MTPDAWEKLRAQLLDYCKNWDSVNPYRVVGWMAELEKEAGEKDCPLERADCPKHNPPKCWQTGEAALTESDVRRIATEEIRKARIV